MTDQNQKHKATWTVMMYIAANDMLANFAVQSLRQLKRAANQDVTVAAQFGANARTNIPRYIFDGKAPDRDEVLSAFKKSGLNPGRSRSPILEEALISVNKEDEIARGTNLADPSMLRAFIDWAYKECWAEHYCLIVWGEGGELLLDDYVVPGAPAKRRNFLTPADLGKALADTQLRKENRKFDVVGIDACCMSMVEVAYELKDHADYLVASQEEVPDFSFPYDTILTAFSEKIAKKEVTPGELCKEIPQLYSYAYQEYILDRQTNMESISLSSLSLKHVGVIAERVKQLTTVLLGLPANDEMRQLIIDARAGCKGFLAGLYVDLCDFCEQLRSQMVAQNIKDDDLAKACDELCNAIQLHDENACVIENQAPQNKHCHGLSIYFPYLTEPDKTAMESPLAPLVKGGMDVLNKGGIDVLNKGGMDVLNKVRRQRIGETESYYGSLAFSKETKWDEFIQQRWSRCLAEDAEQQAKQSPPLDISDLLDERYSAQQCALNLLASNRKLEGKHKGLEPEFPRMDPPGPRPNSNPRGDGPETTSMTNGHAEPQRRQPSTTDVLEPTG
ncbi:MAG TPA: clostripain-related cysteine peptidase [Candidatus Angelobacter sp.]